MVLIIYFYLGEKFNFKIETFPISHMQQIYPDRNLIDSTLISNFQILSNK